MEGNYNKTQKLDINQYLRKEDIDFLNNFYDKKNNVKEELKDVEEKKSKIVKFISENRNKLEDSSKEAREFINNSESVMESIERVYNNLNEILNSYKKIENNLVIIHEKINLKLDNYYLEEDMKNLVNDIKDTIELEEKNNTDNKDNYLIIETFLKQTFKQKPINVSIQSFKDLTIDNLQDNMVLRIYDKRVELPYTKKEVKEYLVTYPKNYKTVQDVLTKEYMVNISLFNKHPVLARFREAYYLCRTKEMMSIFDSFNYAKNLMFRSDLNSYIIAAVKSKKQLEDYIYCLDHNKLNEYKHFKIVFNVNPLAI